jgi:hypothetical protein
MNTEAMTQLYRYAWGNNSKRSTMKGRACILLGTMSLGSVYIEFSDTGERVVTSRRALRRVLIAPRKEGEG